MIISSYFVEMNPFFTWMEEEELQNEKKDRKKCDRGRNGMDRK